MIVRGIGASAIYYGLGYGFSRPDFASAEVEVASDGSVTVWSGASELGQGIRTALCQIAAQELGVSYEDTRIISADTASTPDSGPVSASRSVYIQGRAVIEACRDLKIQLMKVAAQLLGQPVERLAFEHGWFFNLDDPASRLPVSRVAEVCHQQGLRFRGIGWVNNTTSDVDPQTSQGDAYSAYAWASQLAEVEVDLETGQVRVLRLVSATDAGKVINPQAAEGQIEGGAMQGLGFALMENPIVREGVIENADLTTYLIPTAADMPVFVPLLLEIPEPTGPYGAKGIGEPATIPTTPAILNAIADATGIQITRPPATAERILKETGGIPWEDGDTNRPPEEIPYPPP